MTLASSLSIVACALEVAVGLLSISFAAAPGWRHLRLFSFLAFTAALYSASSIPQTLTTAAPTIVWASRVSLAAMALHLAGWIVYSAPVADDRPQLGRLDATLLAALGVAAVLSAWPGALAAPRVHVHEVAWLGLRYATAPPTAAGSAAFLLYYGAALVPTIRYLRRVREGRPGAVAHALGFAVLLATGIVEGLVAAQLLAAPYLMDLGFLAVVLAITGEMSRRVVGDARQLADFSSRLQGQVESRTRELAEAHQALARAERLAAVGQLAAGVAHEINNPLSYVMANAEFLREEAARPEPAAPSAEAREAVEAVREGAERIRRIVLDLKVFARGPADEAGEGHAEVAAVLGSALRIVDHQLRSRARVRTDLDHLPPVAADGARLAQVFVNILTNAAQAIPEGHAAENEIRISARLVDREVVVEVADTGCGIPPELRARIFEPFVTTKQASGGTGLGLSICHGLVSAMGGRIDLDSAPGQGTRVRVYLRRAGREIVTPTPPPRPAPAVAGARARILVVDDEAMVRRAVARTLRDHEVVEAASGAEALRLAAAGETFGAVVCDLTMPDLTGMDVYDELQRIRPDLARRLVVISGGGVSERSRRFLEEAPVRKVKKPFSPAVLRAEVSAVLALPPG